MPKKTFYKMLKHLFFSIKKLGHDKKYINKENVNQKKAKVFLSFFEMPRQNLQIAAACQRKLLLFLFYFYPATCNFLLNEVN
jgi:hypothetical protein